MYLESQLLVIKNREDIWEISRRILDGASNPMVLWFAVSAVDHLFHNRWSQISHEMKKSIREYLFCFMSEKQPQLAPFVVKSVGNLIVRIAVLDWPSQQPNFLSDTVKLLQYPNKWYAESYYWRR